MARLVFKLTKACNFKCSYCYINSSEENGQIVKSSTLIDIDTCKNSFSKALELYPEEDIHIAFFGGEPLVALNIIYEWFDYTDTFEEEIKNKISYSITTNGALINDEVIEKFTERNVYFTLSLDDENKREDIYETIKKIVAFQRSKNKKLLQVRVTITNPNSNQVDIYEKLKSLGVDQIHIMPTTMQNYDYQNFLRNYRNLLDVCENDLFNSKKLYNAQLSIFLSMLYSDKVRNKFCGLGEKYIAVNTDGNIFPCTGFLDLDGFNIGDLKTNNNELTMNLKEFGKNSLYQNKDICLDCWLNRLCAGNCTHAAYIINSDLTRVQVDDCQFMETIGERAIGIYAKCMEDTENVLDEIFGRYDEIFELKLTPSKNVKIFDETYLYSSDDSGHTILRIDAATNHLFDCLHRGYTLKEAFDEINRDVSVSKSEFISSVEGFMDNGLIHDVENHV
jgi:uncharacterized protein